MAKMSARAQKILLVALLIALDISVKKAQIDVMKLQFEVETSKLKKKWQKWIDA